MTTFEKIKQLKLARIKEILNPNLEYEESENNFNFLSKNIREKYKLNDTENISSHGYDIFALELIEEKPQELFLDCGAGSRPEYLENVVNFEIFPYETTDVIGLGEQLPFLDNSFEGVLSLNVLEHVRDPFQCAKEISRVLKPGGKLYCVVPFLCPYHDYPDHYYNMTHAGLYNLFSEHLEVDKQDVIASGLPIFSLTWILNSWANGLENPDRESFLDMKVRDLVSNPVTYLDTPFVKNLSKEKNFELAATTAIWGSKRDPKKSPIEIEEPHFLQGRKQIYQTLNGAGLEIGAFEHPGDLPDCCQVEYCDALSTQEAKTLFPEIDHSKLKTVDHIFDIDRIGLQKFNSDSKDFIIINHVLEHLFDPINAIKECFRVLKKNGKLIVSIPDKHYTFDKDRPITPFHSIENRLKREKRFPIPEDYTDMIKYIHKDLLEKPEDTKQKALESFLRRREHINIWDSELFIDFFQKVVEKHSLNAKPLLQTKAKENSFEYLGLWQKE